MKDQPSSVTLEKFFGAMTALWLEAFVAKQILEVQFTFAHNMALKYFETTGVEMCFHSSRFYPTIMFTYWVFCDPWIC